MLRATIVLKKKRFMGIPWEDYFSKTLGTGRAAIGTVRATAGGKKNAGWHEEQDMGDRKDPWKLVQ